MSNATHDMHSSLAELREVAHLEQRIRGALDPDHAGFLFQRLFDRAGKIRVGIRHAQPHRAFAHALEQAP